MIQFIDLAYQYEKLKIEIKKNIENVLEHGKYIQGPEVQELELKLAEYVGVKYAVTCSSGTDALLMPLMAWGIEKGDAVFTTPFTFIATAEVISLLGAMPVFVDVDPVTYNINPQLLESSIQKVQAEGRLTPKAVISVDLFGLPAEYDKLETITSKYGIKLLEDGAQSFGGVYKGRRAGSFGNAAGTSFFPAKPLGCYGDGGAIFTNDQELCAKLKSIRVHGQGSDKYENVRMGLNGRLDTIQAAILLAKLSIFNEELILRNKVADRYTQGLRGIVKTPEIPEGCLSSWAQYSVLSQNSEERKKLQKVMEIEGIPTAVYYPKPLHLQAAFAGMGHKKGDFPVAEDISSRILSLPMHPYLTDEIIETVIKAFL